MAASLPFRRVAALALLVLLGALVWRFGAEPLYRTWHADRELIAERRDAIGRLRGLAAQRTFYERALAEARQATGTAAALMNAPSATLAAADLQQRVKALVEQNGGSLVSAQPTFAQSSGPFTRLGLSVRMIIATPALQRVVYALETQAPVIVIDEMLVLARGGRVSRRQAQHADELDVRMQLAGFVAASIAREPR